IGLAALILCFAWLVQLTVLSLLPVRAVLCSLPMMVTIVWGLVFGSPLQLPKGAELRLATIGQVVAMQALSGSLSGALVGAFFGSLYASILPIYPICFPLIGWIAGYFCLRNFNQGGLLCVPLVLMLSVLAETINAGQLAIIGRPDVFPHLVQFAVPEAIVNALIAPFVFYPMRVWYLFTREQRKVVGA
ncbi:MAG: rod shape-determining protein MreD, partial [Terriglobales bacterium]